jgi:hypothetical protein
MAAKAVDQTTLLSCWKDIAHYMGTGVRTVQRWEQQAGLPVRRPTSHGQKSQVLLDRRAADAWMASRHLPTIGESRKGARVSASPRTPGLENDIHASRQLHSTHLALTEQVDRHVRLLTTQCALMLELSLDAPWSDTGQIGLAAPHARVPVHDTQSSTEG